MKTIVKKEGKVRKQSMFMLMAGVFFICSFNLFSQVPNSQIKKVHLIFKTHLDIGFTNFSSLVERQYIEEFIPNTLNIIEQLKAEQADERYVWTTGSWLVWEYLQQATPEAVKRLEAAILQGDIVWNGVPYSVETEIMSGDHFATCLKRSQQLDLKYGKKTISSKMTDIPGHTRSIVSWLSDAGISLLHIGVNPSSAYPDVPPICRWKNTDGKEIVLMYQGQYGEDTILPDGETVISINFTGDNRGPHTIQQIKEIFQTARTNYPNAKIESTSLNDVAKDVQKMLDKIPVLTSEIGDTWIHGMGSSPLRIAHYRALSRLFTQWLQTGKLDRNHPSTIDFAVKLGLIAEHTWGFDTKRFMRDYKYDMDDFNSVRNSQQFKDIEQSWAEIDEYIDKAIAFLPPSLQKEARKELEKTGKLVSLNINSHDLHPQLNEHGAYTLSTGGIETVLGELAYQTYSSDDYDKFQDKYLRIKPGWAIHDFGKRELNKSNAKSATLVATLKNSKVKKDKKNTVIQCALQFPENSDVDPSVLPGSVNIEYTIPNAGKMMEMKVSIINKPAVRLPESYLLSFIPKGIQSILVEKTGFMVDVCDVVEGGNRQMHAVDNYLDIITEKGTVRITSLDAPIVAIGERKMLNYSKNLPDVSQGVHLCLFNNLWGTNFTMWWEGSISFRFKIEVIEKNK